MSELTNLVPNLNEIMEEYTERQEEIIQVTQVEIGQGEERTEVSAEPEKPMEELRKRKRGDKEVRAERSGEQARE